jgi:hypothetical protein
MGDSGSKWETQLRLYCRPLALNSRYTGQPSRLWKARCPVRYQRYLSSRHRMSLMSVLGTNTCGALCGVCAR